MKNKYILIAITLLLMIPLVSAAETTVNVKVYPGQDVQLNVLNTKNDDVIAWFTQGSNSSSEVTFTFTTTQNKVDLNVIVRKNGKFVDSKKFEDRSTGGVINLDMTATEPEEEAPVEEPPVEEEQTPEEVVEDVVEEPELDIIEDAGKNLEEVSPITGDAISDAGGKIPKSIFYIVGGVLIIGAVFFLVLKLGARRGGFVRSRRVGHVATNYEIEAIERKIQSAQAELNKIKNREKIADAERQFEEDKKKLDRLRRGEG